MPRRWYVGLISIGVALNALLFGWMYRRRSRRCAQSALEHSPPAAAAPAPQPDRPVVRPIVSPPAAPATTPTSPIASSPITSSRQLPEPNTLSRIAVGVVLVAALLLAVRAQASFSVERWEDRDAGIPYALAAMITFAVAAYLADRWLGKAHDITDCPTAPHKTHAPATTDIVAEIRSSAKRHPWRTAGVITSIVLWLVVLGNLRADPPLPDYSLTLIMWLAAIVLFAVSIISPQPRPRRDWKAWWAQNWLLVVAVGALGLLALALRVINLDTIPPTLGGDEGSQGVEALKILRGELANPFVTSWMSVPTMSFFFNTLTIGPLGHTAFALRLPWALIGTVTVLIMFALTRRLKGLAMGLMVGALLAAYHFHIHYSRLGSNQVADAFFMAAAFFFLYRAYDEGGMMNWVMAGIVAGLAQYFYAGARLVTITVGVTLAYFVVRERRAFVRTHWRGLIAAVAVFIMSAGPMLQFAALHPDEYNGRVNAVGIFQSGWLKVAETEWHQGPLQILIGYQLKRSALAYNAYPDPTSWYGSPRPLFDGLWAILFLLGLGYAHLASTRSPLVSDVDLVVGCDFAGRRAHRESAVEPAAHYVCASGGVLRGVGRVEDRANRRTGISDPWSEYARVSRSEFRSGSLADAALSPAGLGRRPRRRVVLAQRQLVFCRIHAPAHLRQLHGRHRRRAGALRAGKPRSVRSHGVLWRAANVYRLRVDRIPAAGHRRAGYPRTADRAV